MTIKARNFGLALLAVGMLIVSGVSSAQTKINEIRTDQPGQDTDEYFELKGSPGTSLAGLTYIVLGDTGTVNTCGFIETIVPLGTFSIQSDGLLCLRNSLSPGTPGLTGYDGAVPMFFENDDNVTHMLVSGFTGTLDQKLDTNDDGVLDVRPWTAVLDSLGLDQGTTPDCNETERLYSSTRIGPDGTGDFGHVYRLGDTQPWTIGISGTPGVTDTPGAPNLAGPPPIFVDMWRTPCVPLTGQQTTVDVLVENNPTSAELRYRVNGGAENVVQMQIQSTVDDSVYFSAPIPAQAVNGTRIEYYCTASNANPNPTPSYDDGYFVGTMNIASLRVNDANGSNLYRYYGARVRGRVTVAYGTFSAVNTDYNVQDATGGITVFKFDPHTVQPAVGDSVTIVGTLDQFNGKLELAKGGSCDTVLATIHGAGTPPAPLALSLCKLREQHEGLLVRVQGLVINKGADLVFGGNKNYKPTNCPDDSAELFIDADTNIDGQTITSSYMDVVGIAGQFDNAFPYTLRYQVQPRAMADITFLDPTDVPGQAASDAARLWAGAPNPFSRYSEIRYQVPAGPPGAGAPHVRLAVFDLRGRVVATLVDGPVPPGIHVVTIDREALGARGSGIVFCRLEVGRTVLTGKLVMIRP